ncbi:MAG: hypothetical protein EBE86_007515 [Hormoscilla sp. GUM202]|nr:hypothetical protein [Hormoscilla sp. GUM202]
MKTADYKVFPRHVGKWSGTLKVLDANMQQTKSYKTTQNWEQFEDKWVISNTYIYNDGTSKTNQYDVFPLGNGEVEYKTDSPKMKQVTMGAIEHGESTIYVQVVHQGTGKVLDLETMTLVSDTERVRTSQLFDRQGVFKGLLVILDSRVD